MTCADAEETRRSRRFVGRVRWSRGPVGDQARQRKPEQQRREAQQAGHAAPAIDQRVPDRQRGERQERQRRSLLHGQGAPVSRRPEDDGRQLRLYLAIMVIGIVVYLALHGNLGRL